MDETTITKALDRANAIRARVRVFPSAKVLFVEVAPNFMESVVIFLKDEIRDEELSLFVSPLGKMDCRWTRRNIQVIEA